MDKTKFLKNLKNPLWIIVILLVLILGQISEDGIEMFLSALKGYIFIWGVVLFWKAVEDKNIKGFFRKYWLWLILFFIYCLLQCFSFLIPDPAASGRFDI